MKITLITACYNSAATIRTAIESVLSQKGVDVEYIVVDGASTDGTVSLLQEYEAKIGMGDEGCGMRESACSTCSTRLSFKWISERDRGMYDAINKGIKMATGDIVGILNADDVLASDDTLAHIAAVFETHPSSLIPHPSPVEAVYADIRFVKEGDSVEALRAASTVRYCSAKWWRVVVGPRKRN